MDDGRERLINHASATRRRPTWLIIVMINTTFASLLLIVYLAFLIWIYNNLHIRHGVAEVFSGSCPRASQVAAFAYFATSGFAVLLFAAGSHAVQLLLSPTRNEVENAHARDRWVHIGVGGVRNIRWIPKRRLIRAILLTATSVLLPFLHNSIVLKTLATTDRTAGLVTGDYLKGSRLDAATEQTMFLAKAQQYHNLSTSSKAALTAIRYDTLLEEIRANLTDLVHLSPAECRSAYSSSRLPSEFSNVLLISGSNTSNTLDGFVDVELYYPEIAVAPKQQRINWFNMNGTASIFHIHNHCIDTDFDFGNGDVWFVPVWDYYCTAVSYPVEYCLAEKFEPDCGVGLDIRIFYGILVCLFVEIGCLSSLAFSRSFRPFATVGDAVAGFLGQPDSSTSSDVLMAIPAVHSPMSRFDKFGFRRSEKDVAMWKRKWPVWRAAVDTETCALFINCLFLAFFAISIAVLIVYNNDELSNYQPLTLHTPTSTRGLLANLLGLGSIHLAISVTYLFYNHLWSRMLAAAELNTFIKDRGPLRVTLPAPGARSTYYLSIKPHFSGILIIALTLVHFFTTRALNVVAIQIYDVMGGYSHQRITYGISTPSAILALLLGFAMLCALAFGLEKKLYDGMPVLGTCSMAISAACHADDIVMSLRPVTYGKNARTGKMGFFSREV
ncbi:hypothetical protein E4T48_04552 [Aureobasidium sp. EXF-10727]|nr:hypothetical protein E4T48_04552 [Aureobasidium sp. EXF-10727]